MSNTHKQVRWLGLGATSDEHDLNNLAFLAQEYRRAHDETTAAAIEAIAGRYERMRTLLNTPETEDFDKAVPLEAAHQVLRWGAEHDEGKNPEDWFWLVGYLAGKALAAFKAGDFTKAKHHCISASAAMRNWHAHIRSGQSEMRPGISAEKASVGAEHKQIAEGGNNL